MAKHRKFNAHRFLDKLQKHLPILWAYVGMWPECRRSLPHDFGIEDFKTFLAETVADDKEELVEELYRVFDLCTPNGHEFLSDACKSEGYQPDADLHVECLALKVRTENLDAFDLAYDMYYLDAAERFSLYQSQGGTAIRDLPKAPQRLRDHLAPFYLDDIESDRVIVRYFTDDERVIFVIYHEKRRKAQLTFGRKSKTRVIPLIFRPVQQDLVCYDSITGTVEIETGSGKEEENLRRSFAESCLGDKSLFEASDAIEQVDLSSLKSPSFEPHVDDGHSVLVVELHARLGNGRGPTIVIKSKNVLQTLATYSLRSVLRDALIRKAKFRFNFGDDKRGLGVEISLPNHLRFKRARHATTVFGYLRRWRLLRA